MGGRRRTIGLDQALMRDVAAIALAAGAIGVSFGAISIAAGLPRWAVVAMSTLVFAGGAQFMAVGLLAAGSPVAAVFGGLLLNARHVPFGLAVADVLSGRWPTRLLGTHLMVDESVAFALAQQEPHRRSAAYWSTGLALFLAWNLGAIAGTYLGDAVGDPAELGLDAAFPAALLALLLPSLREAEALRVAVLAASIAVPATFFLPAGLPVLLGLGGLVLAIRPPRPPTGRGPADRVPGTGPLRALLARSPWPRRRR